MAPLEPPAGRSERAGDRDTMGAVWIEGLARSRAVAIEGMAPERAGLSPVGVSRELSSFRIFENLVGEGEEASGALN